MICLQAKAVACQRLQGWQSVHALSTEVGYRSKISTLPSRAQSPIVRAAGEDGAAAPPAAPSVAKGNIVRVNQEKYLSSVEFQAVDHPAYFKGLDYIYEARGEVLDLRSYPSGDYALIAWAGIPTAPAWLPVYMLEKAPKLEYKRV